MPAKKKKEEAAVVTIPSRQPQEDNGVKVVSAKHDGGIVDGGAGAGAKLRVILESNSVEKLLLPAARKLAYIQRFDFGMHNAGIEGEGGTYVPDEELAAARAENRDVRVWRLDYIITPML